MEKNIPGFSDMTCQQQRTSRYKLLYVKVIKFLSHAIDLPGNLVLYSFVSHFKRSTSSTLRLHAASTTLAHGDNDDLSWPLRIERKKRLRSHQTITNGTSTPWDWNCTAQLLIYHLVMTNSLPWKITMLLIGTVNHLFLWVIYTMAMLNNQRVDL